MVRPLRSKLPLWVGLFAGVVTLCNPIPAEQKTKLVHIQGTLYGLVSFTMVFSPIQKWVSGFREATFKRNSMVAQWFLLLSAQRDPALIRANLEVESVSLRKE